MNRIPYLDRSMPQAPCRARPLALALSLAFIAGCGAPQQIVEGPPLEPVAYGFTSEGGAVLTTPAEIEQLRSLLLGPGLSTAVASYLTAELDLLEGYFSRALIHYIETLLDTPDSLLGAMAAQRMSQLEDLVGTYPTLVQEALTRLDGRTVNPLTALYLNLLSLQVARNRHGRLGLEPSGPFSGEGLGLPDDWRMAGPFSSFPWLHLERHEAFDEDERLADAYHPSGRRVPTVNILGDELEVQRSFRSQGIYVFETWAHLDADSERIAVLETHMPAVLTIDSNPVLARSTSGLYDPSVVLRPIRMESGWHRIRLKIGVTESNGGFRLRLVSRQVGETGLTFSAAPPRDARMGRSRPGSSGPVGLLRLLPADSDVTGSALGAFGLLLLATDFQDEDAALRAIEVLAPGTTLSPVVAMLLAAFEGQRPTRSPGDRLTVQIQRLREVLAVAPSAGAAASTMAALLSSDGRDLEALRVLAPFARRMAGEEAMVLGLTELYLDQGWNELAESELTRILSTIPEACGVIERLVHLWELRDHYPDVEELAQGFRSCEVGLLYQIERVWLPRGQDEQALQALEVLSRRHPDDIEYHRQIYNLLMLQGRHTEALTRLEQAAAYADDPVALALLEIDGSLATGGDETQAIERLEAVMAEEDPGDYRLLSTRSYLGRSPILGELRLDTAEAVRDYREHDTNLRAGSVYALDYAAYRYFQNGSGLGVTHQILHLMSRDALAQYGEITVPQNSLLLRARTITADGTILEPDYIAGKDTISLPNLQVGDFVELEFLDVLPPSALSAESMLGSRFYFQLPDSAFHRSEMVVEVPDSWSELLVDRRGQAPLPQVTERDGFSCYTFTVNDSRPPVMEPGAPSADEYLTSVRVAHAIEWSDIQRAYQDRYRFVVRPAPQIETRTLELTDGIDDPREQVRRIYRFIMDEVQDVGGFLDTDAIWTLRSQEGERLPLLLALLEARDFEPELVFLRSWEDDQTDSPIPDGNTFPETVVRVRLQDGDCWLFTGQEHGVFDFLPPELQGVEGIVIARHETDSVQRIETPVWPDEAYEIRIAMDLTLDADGNVSGQVVEHYPINQAASMRWMLEQNQDRQDLIQQLEQELSLSLSGVAVSELVIEGAEQAEGPLRIEYHVEAPRFARIEAQTLTIDTRIMDRQIRNHLGAVPSRSYPLNVSFPFREELSLRLHVPEPYRFTALPSSARLSHPLLDYSWDIDPGGRGQASVHLVRQTALRVGRVSPEDYPELLELLRRVDQMESLHITAEP